jgi:TusA-related sulfurtransferase
MARRLEVGGLELGGGLEVLLSAALEGVAPGETIEVLTPSRGVALEVPGWASAGGHRAGEPRREGGRDGPVFVVSVIRAGPRRILADALPAAGRPPRLRDGEFHSADMRAAPPPAAAPPGAGLAPLGAVPENGAPEFSWALNDLDSIWAHDVAELTEQASAAQWDASRDVPWEAAAGLPVEVERAVAQVMTYVAQNECAALYVPSRFLPQVNPRYAEMLMWLAAHVHDEARHLEVFTKRSLVGGQAGYALASTELSLRTLLDETDFTAASLLLNVLGEGTFLDLLAFVEGHAPDAATATAARLAHRDEQRHVHFGISHVRRALAADPDLAGVLVAAAENRTAKLASLSQLSPVVTESLVLMSAASRNPAEIGEAARAVQGLLARMADNRVRRLRAAGFDEPTAQHLSDLHTPNLM